MTETQDIGLMHGNDWQGQDVSGWIASEKFDGHRVRWTGEKLVSRSGADLKAPGYFTIHLPSFEVDCELWAGRGKNHNDVKKLLARGAWHELQVVAFDVPGMNEESARLELGGIRGAAAFTVVSSTEHAKNMMHSIVAQGGEGIMLRKPGSDYLPFRCDVLLKLKP